MSDVTQLKVINPLDYPEWDKLVLSTRDYSFFHSSAWAKVLYETYRYKPIYFTLIKNNQLVALIPFMEVGGILNGKKGVSLPFSDYCKKRNIKKSEREGVEVKILNSLESLNEFYKLNCITRKKHGLPPQPYNFF